MTYAEALRIGTDTLSEAGIENSSTEAAMFLCSAIQKDRAHIYTHPFYKISEGQIEVFTKNIKRRAKRMPAQYILGRQEFMSLDFCVNPAVLIPRPETEFLVEAAILHLGDRKASILDVGTGSGCIAISVAYYRRQCRAVAADISAEALKVAALNADKAGVSDRVELVNSDLFKNLKGRTFDVILSNPPYIPTGDIAKLEPEVRLNEPYEALDGGTDGLDTIRDIIRGAPAFLNKNGLLAIEIGKGQSGAVQKMMEEFFRDIEVIEDLQRIPRVLKGTKRGK